MPSDRTHAERLAVIEEVVLRTEQKLDAHIEKHEEHDKRLSRLERAFAWSSGAAAAIVTGLSLYVKAHFRS